jgi:hypothetical protein
MAINTTVALDDVVNGKKPDKTPKQEEEIKFSWIRVAKRGIQNMKDDVDPIYKGAKMGVYALHGIPTWRREYLDGKLENDSHGWATISGMFVGGASCVGYYLATTTAVAASGPVGYAVLGIPVASQAASYTREAFRRARKTELANVVMTRIGKAVKNGTGDKYDLTCKDLAGMMVPEKETFVEKENGYGRRTQTEYEKERKDFDERQVQRIAMAEEKGRETMMKLAGKIFDGLFADDQVGSTYVMSRDLRAGPARKERDAYNRYNDTTDASLIAKGLEDAIVKNGGSANVELFGKMSVMYDNSGKVTGYQVEPNKLWKK